jgi:hypothetical protein
MIRRRPYSLFRLLAIVLLAGAGAATSARAQRSPFPEGSESIRWMLKNSGLSAQADVDQLRADPEHSILIVLGDLNWLERKLPEGPEEFVRSGGALLIASDQAAHKILHNVAGVRIDGHLIVDQRHLDRCHRKQPYRPFVKSTDAHLPDGSENPFAGLQVATNIPSYLTIESNVPPGIVPLAEYFPDVGEDEAFGGAGVAKYPRGKRHDFAVGGRPDSSKGRILILADHSVFINEMLLDEECDNFAFTQRVIDWLKGDGQRTHATLVVDGKAPFANFDVVLKRLPRPPALKILQEMLARRDEVVMAAERTIARTELDDGINAALMKGVEGEGEAGVARLRRYTLWALAGGIAFYFFYRLSDDARFFGENRLPRLEMAVAGQNLAGTFAEQRQRAQIAVGNLGESARALARQRFESLTGAGNVPVLPVIAGGGFWQRRSARRRLKYLWKIAYGASPTRVTPLQWHKYLTDLQELERDVANGVVKMPVA